MYIRPEFAYIHLNILAVDSTQLAGQFEEFECFFKSDCLDRHTT